MAERLAIRSVDNPKVKDAAKLRDRRGRRKSGRFLVEGHRELVHALEAGLVPELLFVEEGRVAAAGATAPATGAGSCFPDGAATVERAAAAGARVATVSESVWAKLAIREDRDGLLAVLPIPDVSLDALALPPEPLVLAASGIEKPGNVGALLRSADAFGVDAFVVAGGTDLWNPNVVRASLGCLFTVPVAAAPPGRLISWLRECGLRIVAATPEGDALPHGAPLTGAIAVVLGSEEHGLAAGDLADADLRVRIPMRGRADSLNVSVSAGILLYEADRQRTLRS